MKEVGSLWGIGGFAVEGGGMAGQEPRQAMASNPQRRSRDLLRGRGYDIHTLKVGGAHLPPPAREARGGGGRGGGRPGGEGGLGRAPSGVGGRFLDHKARLSMAALAQSPRHPRRPRASPSHPPPLPPPPPPPPPPPGGRGARRARGGGGGHVRGPPAVDDSLEPIARRTATP